MKCECGAFLTKEPTGEVEPWTDEREPYGCYYWTCKRCGHQVVISKPKPEAPEPKGWQTNPF